MVFARSYGPHNEQAKELLIKLQRSIDVQIEFLDVDLLEGFDGSLILLELQQLTGQWALPNIFIGNKHVGGNSELDQIHAIGKLEDMLREAGNEL
jgi:glutaredoxin 3